MISKNWDYHWSILITGDSETGKSSIVDMFAKGSINDIEDDRFPIRTKEIYYKMENKVVFIKVWDSLGKEHYKPLIT